MTIYLDLPDDIAARLLSRPEAERNALAISAIRAKLDAEDDETMRHRAYDSVTERDDLASFVSAMAAKVAKSGGVERIARSQLYAERGP